MLTPLSLRLSVGWRGVALVPRRPLILFALPMTGRFIAFYTNLIDKLINTVGVGWVGLEGQSDRPEVFFSDFGRWQMPMEVVVCAFSFDFVTVPIRGVNVFPSTPFNRTGCDSSARAGGGGGGAGVLCSMATFSPWAADIQSHFGGVRSLLFSFFFFYRVSTGESTKVPPFRSARNSATTGKTTFHHPDGSHCFFGEVSIY